MSIKIRGDTDFEMPQVRMPQGGMGAVVWALQIAKVEQLPRGRGKLTFEPVPNVADVERTTPPDKEVCADYMRKHEPQAGGYYVVYEDDYESWSPAEAFETGYALF